MVIQYDSTVDALDIRLLSGAEVTESIDVDDRRVVDLDAKGRLISIEVMGASHGFEVQDLIQEYGLHSYAAHLTEIAQGRLPVSQP